MLVKLAYKKLGPLIPVLCIILVGMVVLKKKPEDISVTAQATKEKTEEKKEEKQAKKKAKKSVENPRVALTFDDGPHKRYTPQILEGLAKRNVKASFFLLGQNIEGNEEIVKQMYKDGHLIGNHSFSHVRLTSLRGQKACDELMKTSNLVYDIVGVYPIYVRPPFGEWRKGLTCEELMIPVFWTVDSSDWQVQNVDKIVKKVVSNVKDGDIILMHDWYGTSVTAAMEIVDKLTKEGYDFVTVDQLIYE